MIFPEIKYPINNFFKSTIKKKGGHRTIFELN